MEKPSYECYMNYSSENYGINALRFYDAQGHSFWYSYRTLVAFWGKNGKVCIQNYWGPTTGKHLNAIEPDKKARVDSETFDRLYEETFGQKAPE